MPAGRDRAPAGEPPDPSPGASRRLDARAPRRSQPPALADPGIGVKRWLLLTFAGLLILALGVAHVIRQATRDLEPGGLAGTILDAVTFQFLPYPLRGLLVGIVGLGARSATAPTARSAR